MRTLVRETIKLLTGIYSRHTGLIMKRKDVDCSDINIYIKHALENGFVESSELKNYFSKT